MSGFKPPKIVVENSNFIGCKTGISVSHGTDLKVSGTTFDRVQLAITQRDPTSLAAALGVPGNAPPELVREFFDVLQRAKQLPEAERAPVVEGSRLVQWWGSLADTAALGGADVVGAIRACVDAAMDWCSR